MFQSTAPSAKWAGDTIVSVTTRAFTFYFHALQVEGYTPHSSSWVHAGGNVEPGLVSRSKAEMEMFTGAQQ